MFFILAIVRWITLPDMLPQTWTPSSDVRFTAWILERPELTDSKTIIRKGNWRIEIKGYKDIMPGAKYVFVGRVEPQVLLSKTVKIVMMEPTIEVVDNAKMGVGESLVMTLSLFRERMVNYLQKWLPEPHASLAAGILLGVKRAMPWDFYQSLVATGTLHIVAASGYNVNIVAAVVMQILVMFVSRGWAIAGGVAAIGLYVVLAGGGAAVTRAAIMGSLTLAAFYWGRRAEAKRMLWVTAGIMLLVQPLMIVDVGFLLSVSATAGLLYLEPLISHIATSHIGKNGITRYLAEYLYPTLAATLATLPVTILWFSRASLLAPITNMLVLPLTPIIMLLTALAIAGGMIWERLGWVLSLILYVPLAIFVQVIRLFG